ncbi:hypothetical protein M0R72_00865 [Candidatus Pacearchaeota archaeon]|jgi:hypothetical protein|nr:hypothetical protein [Candidatus Pacearchaeota archaeon]
MATQVKVKRTREKHEKVIYLSRQETVGLIQNLIVLLTDPIGGGVTNMMVYCEDRRKNPYRLFLIPRRPEPVAAKKPYRFTVNGVVVEADSKDAATALAQEIRKGKKVVIRKHRRRA